MGKVYVSDVLEHILDAQQTRDSVRRFSGVILCRVPEAARSELERRLHYIGGKCMGYPVIWLVEHSLELSRDEFDERLEQAAGPLLISLTTSITDDFMDGDEEMTPGHMMLVYLLLFEALRRPHWFNGQQEALYINQIYPLITSFVDEGKNIGDIISDNLLHHRAMRAGRRIGAFHETIAYAMAVGVVEPERLREMIRIAGRFGDWCSHLDDIFDIETDIENGSNITLPIYWLRCSDKRIKKAIDNRRVDLCAPLIRSTSFLSRLTDESCRMLTDIAVDAKTSGFTVLSHQLEQATERLPTVIRDYRKRVVENWMTSFDRISSTTLKKQPDAETDY